MKGMFALLSTDEEIGTGSETELEAAQTETEVAQGVAETTTADADIEKDVTAVDTAMDASDELEDIGNVAADAVESGEGLDEKAAEIATIAVESIFNRLSIPTKQTIVLARESFGHTNTRLDSTKVIVEGVVDTIKKVWAGIKQFAVRIWEKIKLFFAGITKSSKALGKQIEDLKERAKRAEGEPPKENLKNSSLATKLSTGQSGVPSDSEYNILASNAKKLIAASNAVAVLRNDIENALTPLAQKAEVTKSDFTVLDHATNTYAKAVGAALNPIVKVTDQKILTLVGEKGSDGKDIEGTVYGTFVGSRFLVHQTKTLNDGSVENILAWKTRHYEKKVEEVTPLDTGRILSLLNVAGNLNDDFDALEKTNKSLEKTKSRVEDLAASVMKSADKLVDKEGNADFSRLIKKLQQQSKEAFEVINTFGRQTPAIVFETARTGAEYASVSLAALKSK